MVIQTLVAKGVGLLGRGVTRGMIALETKGKINWFKLLYNTITTLLVLSLGKHETSSKKKPSH